MISIIMIVYDVEKYVEQSIKSVLDQTYRDIEVVIVADHGPDRSEEICERFDGAHASVVRPLYCAVRRHGRFVRL